MLIHSEPQDLSELDCAITGCKVHTEPDSYPFEYYNSLHECMADDTRHPYLSKRLRCYIAAEPIQSFVLRQGKPRLEPQKVHQRHTRIGLVPGQYNALRTP